MKSFRIQSDFRIESLTIDETPVPIVKPGQVLVQLKTVSLNYRDLLVVKGIDRWRPPVGRIPVSDGMGTIVETGSGVSELAVGDRVAGLFYPFWIDGRLTEDKLGRSLGGAATDGLLREFAVFNEQELIRIPDYLSDEEAATLPCAGLTAWHGLMEKGPVLKNATVLIQGTGGVSLFSAQFALAEGARVILLSGSDEKLARARELGVTDLINYKKVPDWDLEVQKRTEGRGADHIVEVVGAENINKSLRAVGYDGSISVIGLVDGLSGRIDTVDIMRKQARLQGIQVGSKAMFARMNEWMTRHDLHPVIDRTFAFTASREALSYLEKSAAFGKIAIRIAG